MYNGLKLAQELHVHKIWVQSESKVVVEMLTGNFTWCLEHAPLLNLCKTLLDDDAWETPISRCYREGNQVVDKLANLGLSRPLGV